MCPIRGSGDELSHRATRARQRDMSYGDALGRDSNDAHDDHENRPKRARTLEAHVVQGAWQRCPIRGSEDEPGHPATRTTVAQSPSSTANLLWSGHVAPSCRCCRWFPRAAYHHGPRPEDRARIAIETVVEGIKPQGPPVRGVGGCYMCASRRDSTSATTGHECDHRVYVAGSTITADNLVQVEEK